MDSEEEIIRLNIGENFEYYPKHPWVFEVGFDSDALCHVRRILSVVGLIANYSHKGGWPSDCEWRSLMPVWVKEGIPELTKGQIDFLLKKTPRDQWDSLPWEFLSWLDALRDRGWRWWGFRCRRNHATIVVEIVDFPERIDCFRELLRASGGKIVKEDYEWIYREG